MPMSREIGDWDVAVVGGGTAGTVAAVQAARAGCRTLLIEKAAGLGGTITTAGVSAPQGHHAWGRQVVAGIGWEWICRSRTVLGEPVPDGSVYDPKSGVTTVQVDRFVFGAVADEMAREAGVALRLHTVLAGAEYADGAWRLTLCGKEGLWPARCRVLLDCTGDANAVQRAGLPVRRSPVVQPGTLVMRLDGYDPSALDLSVIQQAFDAAVQAGELQRSDAGWGNGNIAPLLRMRGGNCIHVPVADADGSEGKTDAEVTGRRVLLRLLLFLRRQPGLDRLRVAWSAPECGIRETVVIEGRCRVDAERYAKGYVWPDAVCYSFYPIDVHEEHGLNYRPMERGIVPTLPFGALLPAAGRQIAVAGRCADGDRLANSSYRVQAPCMAMGQAVGAAAALAIRAGRDIADVPLEALRELLVRHGAIVPQR
jgi:hypothetical protein